MNDTKREEIIPSGNITNNQPTSSFLKDENSTSLVHNHISMLDKPPLPAGKYTYILHPLELHVFPVFFLYTKFTPSELHPPWTFKGIMGNGVVQWRINSTFNNTLSTLHFMWR